MPRILLLLDSVADFQTTRCADVLTQNPGADFQITTRTIGPGGSYLNGPAALYRLRGMRNDFDLIHAFGPQSLSLAAMATRLPLLYSPLPVTSRHTIQWTRAISNYRNVQFLCPTSTLRRLHVEAGIPIGNTHLLRPGVDFSRLPRHRPDSDLRACLGFSADDRVILAVGEQSRASHHVAAVWASGILHVLDPRYKLLLWGRGKQVGHLNRLAPKVRQSHMIQFAPEWDYEKLLAVADVALICAKGLIPTLSIAMTMAAGVPIVSSVTYTTSELLEDRHTGLLVANPSPKLLAKRITDLYDNAHLAWSIADRARAEAYDFFPLTAFLAQYRSVCQQILSQSQHSQKQETPV
ncbi:MAG TPA: glycosyltransferase family 4 protein [Tepidisphaeraceae bacterium]|jgi:glycosyltransferase involved in cell wall biosynthesis|nr:glycosyltransferase family 4 protein [Tepidisphaeraceae bacterium]